MHYIVLDLEWNQAEGKIGHEGGLPFEIVEIGAIKLNRRMQIVDRFEEIIRPRIYPHMHFMTTKIIQLDKKDLEKGKDFPEVMERFLKWCGRKYRFCIWGTLDITELQRNMCYYGMDELTDRPLPFMDVQKLYSLAYEDGKTRRALEYAVDELNIRKDEPFHRAINDAYYTARVLEQIHKDHTEVESYLSFDLFMLPRNKKDEVSVRFKTYSKYISREFEDKTVAMQDKTVSATKCCICGRPTKKVIKWFSVNGRHYYYVGICKRHGYIKAKIRMKKADDGNVFVVKTIKVTDQDGVDAIKEKQEKLRAQRAERRHRE
ncbi:MAG: exonuclease domain-containing protein [Lachnospiraceae bacterium]|nr:exonuclease domain-containing protein [Lachnospiraceae bacterium]